MNYNCVALKLKEVNALSDKFYTRKFKELELPILMNHIQLFYILSSSLKPLAFTEIFNMWDISKSSLSEIINKYQKMGFLEKISSADDKRSFTIVLTEEGKEIRAILGKIEDEWLSVFYSNFDDETRADFEKNVERLLKNLSDI